MTAENPHGVTGDCEWEYDSECETLFITGSGRMRDYFDTDFDGVEQPLNTPWEDYKETMRAVVIDQGVKNVGKFAFDGCYELETADIGTDVEVIGKGAFRSSALAEIDLSGSVDTIEDEAFAGCGALKTVRLSRFIASIGEKAFFAAGLREITIPNAAVSFGSRSFGYDVNDRAVSGFTVYGIPGSTAETYADDNGFKFVPIGGVTGDCWWTFDDDTNTLSIGGSGEMEDGDGAEMMPWTHFVVNDNDPWHLFFEGDITHIGAFAFEGLPIEGDVNIPYTCISIGEAAFRGCKLLSGADLTNVQYIRDGAFADCSSLFSLDLQATQTIGDNAFKDCSNISTVMFGSELVTIGYSAFAGCYNLESVDIPNTVMTIGDGAFQSCSSLTGVNFGDNNNSVLRSIGSEAFTRCDLSTVTIPDSVITIGDSAFSYNTNLEWLTLGKGLESIGADAFYGAAVTSVTIHGAVTEIGNHSFGYHLEKNGAAAHIAPVDNLYIYGLTGSEAERYAATEENFHFIANDMNEGKTGDCTWYYDDTNYILYVYGSGMMGDYENPEDVPWYGKNGGYIEVEFGENVVYIGKNCFSGVQGGILIPETICEIYDKAVGYDGDGSPISGFRILGYPDTHAQEYANWHEHIRFKDITPRPYNPDSGTNGGDNIYWAFDKETDTLTIEPNDDNWTATIDDFDFPANAPWGGQGKKAPWAKYSKINSVEIKAGVTSIGAYAFAFLDRLIDVDVSGTVTAIGEGAFYGTGVDALRLYNPNCTIGAYALGYGDDPDTGVSYTPFPATIGGYKGSPAQKYADNNENITFYDMGATVLYDEETHVMITTTEPDVELVVTQETTGSIVVEVNGSVQSAYDISLKKDGEEVQPEEAVTVRLPFAGEYDENVKVYRVEADGSLTDMNAEYVDGDLIFTTDHFSLYIVVQEETKPVALAVFGDVDGDGEVTVIDATFIQRYEANMKIPISEDVLLKCGDVDGDGEVTVIDATFIQRYEARIKTPYPIGEPIS